MSERTLVLDKEASMSRALAKVLERDQFAGERVVEIRLQESLGHDQHGMLFTNRKDRRSMRSSKKHLKGLRP